jgi:hypothetical protein
MEQFAGVFDFDNARELAYLMLCSSGCSDTIRKTRELTRLFFLVPRSIPSVESSIFGHLSDAYL